MGKGRKGVLRVRGEGGNGPSDGTVVVGDGEGVRGHRNYSGLLDLIPSSRLNTVGVGFEGGLPSCIKRFYK